MHQRSTGRKKPPTLSPNQKLLRSFYSKKSRSEYSPSGERSVSKEQIKQQIKKVVYNCSKHNQQRLPRGSQVEGSSVGDGSVRKIGSSLTPKHYMHSRRTEKEPRTSKASESRGKQLFVSSGRYDSKHPFDKSHKTIQDDKHRPSHDEKYKPNSLHKRTHSTAQEETIKFSERRNQEDANSVKAFLTAEEYSKFGDRFPEKFKRVGLLGRGGFSLVWLGVHRSSKRKVAVKQILTKNPHETHLKQIWFGSYFFEKGGEPREEFQTHIGINNICRLYSYQITTVDSWLYYEVCEQTLGSGLFELRGETAEGQRNYRVEYKSLLHHMRSNQNELRVLLAEVAKALHLINSHNIVHSDLKTENILLRLRRRDDPQSSGKSLIRGVKLIDFGSSFLFTNLKQFSMATPQYMPPQILNYILYQNKLEYDADMLLKMERYRNPWVIDMWSLGCIVLEIVSGVPLWMSVETRIEETGPKVTGLFSAKNRVFAKIIQKQIEVVNELDTHLDKHNYSGIKLEEDLRRLLKQMLHLEPQERISPLQLLRELGVECQPTRIPSY